MGLQHQRQKELYNKSSNGDPFKVGDMVWLHCPAVPRGKSPKLHCFWQGPYRIHKVVSDVLYNISLRDRPRKHQVVHFDRLKPCVHLPSNLQERQQNPAETILPDGPDVPADLILDGTDNGPILPVVPGDLDETDDDLDDDGPEYPDEPAVPEDIDETDAPQDLQIAPQYLPMAQAEEGPTVVKEAPSIPEDQLNLMQDLKDWDRTFMTFMGLPFSGRGSSIVCLCAHAQFLIFRYISAFPVRYMALIISCTGLATHVHAYVLRKFCLSPLISCNEVLGYSSQINCIIHLFVTVE